VVGTGDDEWHARYVLLATGVEDRLPPLRGAEEAVLRSVMRVCPICDAFEATGKNIAVIGDGEHGDREAQFLRTYSDEVALIHIGDARPPHADRPLVMRGIEILTVAFSGRAGRASQIGNLPGKVSMVIQRSSVNSSMPALPPKRP